MGPPLQGGQDRRARHLQVDAAEQGVGAEPGARGPLGLRLLYAGHARHQPAPHRHGPGPGRAAQETVVSPKAECSSSAAAAAPAVTSPTGTLDGAKPAETGPQQYLRQSLAVG